MRTFNERTEEVTKPELYEMKSVNYLNQLIIYK